MQSYGKQGQEFKSSLPPKDCCVVSCCVLHSTFKMFLTETNQRTKPLNDSYK